MEKNLHEVPVAVAIGLFGHSSAAALATVVGVLIGLAAMHSIAAFPNRTKGWYPAPAACP